MARFFILLAIFCLLSTLASPMDAVLFDGRGRIKALNYEGELLAVDSDIRVATPKWAHFAGQSPWSSDRFKLADKNGVREITGRLIVAEGKTCLLKETITRDKDAAHIDFAVTAESDLELDGVTFFFRLPVDRFVGGQGRMEPQGNEPARTAQFPKDKPEDPHFLSAQSRTVTLQNQAGDKQITLTFDQVRPVTFQDDRQWKDAMYSTYTRFHNGNLTKGETATLGVTITVAGKGDHSPVHLTVDRTKPLYDFKGFGGSYVYGIDAPVAQYTLNNLPVAFSRTEMSLWEWEPKNDNDTPDDANWTYLEAQDKGGLHNEFLIAQQLQQKGIPFAISIWHLPEWMYADPGKPFDTHARKIDADKWPEVLESIGSYLLYAKRQYGTEPDFFSFNECDSGVMVLFTTEEYCDMVKRVGVCLKKLGLKTKILLSDTAGVDRSLKFTALASKDPEAMIHVGAVAFHSWGGATPEQYHAWREYADGLNLSLYVTEVGVDSSAWQTPWSIDTFHYAIQELRMYQELLLYAWPLATVQWEYSGDYPLCRVEKDPNGQPKVMPTWRYWFIDQFSRFLPHHSKALATSSDQATVLCTAFMSQHQKPVTHTVYISNLGPSKTATIAGLPAGRYRLIVSDEANDLKEVQTVEMKNRTLEFELPALSLVTLQSIGLR